MKKYHKKERTKKAQEENNSKSTSKRQYSRISSIVWAMKKLWELDRSFVFFIFASVPVAVILPLVTAYFPKVLLDRIGAGRTLSELFAVAAGFLFTARALSILKEFIDGRCNARSYYPTCVYQTEMSAFQDYRTDFENTEKQDFKENGGYAWQDACQGRCAMEYVWQDLSQALIHFFGIISYASLLLALEPIIFAVVAAVSAASYFMTRWQPKYYDKHKARWEKEIRKKNYLQGLSGDFSRAKDIKLYGLSNWLGQMMQDYQSYILLWNKRCSLRGMLAAVLSALLAVLQNGTAYLVLIGTLLEGPIAVGEFVFYFGLVGQIAGFLQGIIGDVAKLNTRADKIAYYRVFFDYPDRFNHGEGCALPDAPVEVEFRDVWYRYDGAKDYTLKGVSLTIRKGERLALVGMNGAGKTTLVKLLCGLYAPQKGEILVGGKRIGEYNIEEYYSMISVVFQEIRALAFTVFEFVASAAGGKE